MGIRGARTDVCLSWQGLGNLRNGGNAGLWYVNANNGLGNANWNIGSRLSGWQLSHHTPSTAHPQ